MGCDGGTKVDKRDIIVKVRKEKKGMDKELRNQLVWDVCTISKEKLTEPIVCCALGRLYNKEALVEALIRRKSTKKPDELIEHIQSLKDITNIHFSPNPEHAKDNTKSKFICPITQQEIRGLYKFYAVAKCGHVVSEKAIQMTESSNKSCLVCNEPVTELILLNKSETEEKELREKLLAAIATNPVKKSKKRARKEEKAEQVPTDEVVPEKKKIKTTTPETSTVYKSLFIDKTKSETSGNFLNRGGIRSILN
jgi:hypothetical protein